MPKYLVKKYYSTFFEQEVEADNEDQAREKSKHFHEIKAPEHSILSLVTEVIGNLKPWKEANEIEEIK
jgi:hypothetical protein